MVTVTAMGWATLHYYTLYYYKLPPFNTIILLSSPCTLLYFLTFLSNWNPLDSMLDVQNLNRM